MKDTENPKVAKLGRCSVICVTYNHERFSRSGLLSILAQDHRDIEIIVLDDGSTDENLKVVRATLSDCSVPYRIIEQENTGNVPLNFNRARMAATGEFLAMMSLDDMLAPHAISRKVLALRAQTSAAICVDMYHHEIDAADQITTSSQPTEISKIKVNSARDLIECEFATLGSFYIQGALFKSEIFDAVGGFDEDMTGDDIILRTKCFYHMLEHPEITISLLPEVGFLYRKHEDNLHYRTFRQLQTIVQWRDRYYPDRDLPDQFESWLRHHIINSVHMRSIGEIARAEALGADVKRMSRRFKRSRGYWIMRSSYWKQSLRNKIGLENRR